MANEEKKPVVKRPKKLSKTVEGTVLTITAGGSTLKFDITQLSKDIQAKCSMHGLSQKLGDAAASKDDEAHIVESINKTWDALKTGDWSFRVPAGPKITKAALGEKLGTLNTKDQEAAKAILAKLGIVL